MAQIIIGEHNWKQFAHDQVVSGERKARGLIPRDYDTNPVGSYRGSQSIDIPLIPQSEWSERIKTKVGQKSQLSNLRLDKLGGPAFASLDQGQVGYCLPPGSLIRMGDGSQKRIEDVRLLDEVLTAEGNVRRVEQCHVRDHAGEMINVKAWGHGHLRLTPNHSILTKRGYIPAGELRVGDWLSIPRFAPHTATIIQTANHVSGSRKRVGLLGKLQEMDGTETWHPNTKPIPDIIHMTPGLGRLLGLWLAEGCFESGSVIWCLGNHASEPKPEEVVSLIEQELGLDASTSPGPTPTVTIVQLYGKLWRELFESLCGRLAGGKRLHPDLTSGPREFLEALFWGWIDGDGHTRGKRGVYKSAASVSHALALGMYDIANFLGLCPSINKEKPQKSPDVKRRLPPWKVQVNLNPSSYRPDYRSQSDTEYMWRKVYQINRAPYTGKVYNIGVAGDNSYVAEGVGVHNCWAHSSTHAVMYLRLSANLPTVPLSAYSVAATIKRGADEGGWGAQSLDFIMEKGVMSQNIWPQGDRNYRTYDKAENWTNAALHKVTEGWVDIPAAQYDRKLTWDQVITLVLSDVPVVTDFNWWSHSVLGIDAVDGNGLYGVYRIEETGKLATVTEYELIWGINDPMTAGIGLRIQNSWGDSWSQQGTGILTGSKAVPDGAVAPRAVIASAA